MKRSKKLSKLRNFLLLLSFLIFPITMNWFSPYLPVAGAANAIIAGSILTYIALFVGSIFFGRFFCGWFCPMGALQEGCFSVNDKKVKQGWVQWLKWFIWIPWFGFIISLLIKAGSLTVQPLYLFEQGVSVDSIPGVIRYIFVVFLVFFIAVTGGKRLTCHSACWIAPFMILGSRLGKAITVPRLHLSSDKQNCTQCRSCSGSCPMSLPVSEMVKSGSNYHKECILCGNCTKSCPDSCIEITFGRER